MPGTASSVADQRGDDTRAAPGQVVLALRRLARSFGPVVAVDGFDLEIREGELITLLGPSGCGKTTTIRMIGGYVEPTAGTIELDGRDVTAVPPQRRDMGMVFQHYALFPHMTVFGNIAYPLRLRKWSRRRIAERVAEMLELVRLPDVGRRHPEQLSGGQQQRIALARALAFSPRMLLMDEALGALDAKLREYMQVEVRRIQQELKITTVHVTHDQEEALGMSDRVVVMRDGRIAQVDEPRALYDRPSGAYVADFIGRINLLPARVVEHTADATVLEATDPTLPEGTCRRVVAPPAPRFPVGTAVRAGIRPEAMTVSAEPAAENCLGGSVLGVRFAGALEYVTVDVGAGQPVTAAGGGAGTGGDRVHVRWPAAKTLVLDDD